MARTPKEESVSSNVDPDKVLEALEWYSGLRGEIASIQQEIATGLTRYEKQGIDKKALKVAYGLKASDATPEEIAAQRRRENDYLIWAGIITVEADGQTSMVTGLEPKKPSAKAAKKLADGKVQSDGYNTARAGGTLDDNPHTAGTEEYALWAEAFTQSRHDQQEEAEKAALPPAKRGRPAKGTRAPQPPAETAEEATARAQAHLSGGDMPADPF
jgi:hypothetical protein